MTCAVVMPTQLIQLIDFYPRVSYAFDSTRDSKDSGHVDCVMHLYIVGDILNENEKEKNNNLCLILIIIIIIVMMVIITNKKKERERERGLMQCQRIWSAVSLHVQ